MAKILVIEDEKEALGSICKALQMEGYETIEAEDGEAGIKLAKGQYPDLIVCDVLMPKKNGIEVIEELRKEPETAEIPLIFLTINTDRINIDKAFECGARDYISKPYEIKEVMARIRVHLRSKMESDNLKKLVDEVYRQLDKLEEVKQTLEAKLKNINQIG